MKGEVIALLGSITISTLQNEANRSAGDAQMNEMLMRINMDELLPYQYA